MPPQAQLILASLSYRAAYLGAVAQNDWYRMSHTRAYQANLFLVRPPSGIEGGASPKQARWVDAWEIPIIEHFWKPLSSAALVKLPLSWPWPPLRLSWSFWAVFAISSPISICVRVYVCLCLLYKSWVPSEQKIYIVIWLHKWAQEQIYTSRYYIKLYISSWTSREMYL